MNLSQVADLLELKAPSIPIRRFVVDSRHIEKGDCFVALKGARTDGHDFMDAAFSKGASCCIAEKPHPRSLLVDDSLAALQRIAQKRLEKCAVYGLTGAMGKTTTKHFVQRLMPGAFPVTPANYNTRISLPLTVLNELGEASSIFLEMGMTETGDLKRLIEIAPPTVAMVTYIPSALEDYIHAAAFSSLKEVFDAKMEIFQSPKLEKALLPDDLPFPAPPIQAEIESFSLKDKGADYALILSDRAEYFEKGKLQLSLPRPFPDHHARNFLCGIAYARALGASLEQIAERAPLFELPPMRFEKRESGGLTVISDAYNASPEAMITAFSSLPKAKRRIGVLGEMLMLGRFDQVGHHKVLQEALKYFDHLYCYGKRWTGLDGDFQLFENRDALTAALMGEVQRGDLIYVKGSRDLGLERVVDELMGDAAL